MANIKLQAAPVPTKGTGAFKPKTFSTDITGVIGAPSQWIRRCSTYIHEATGEERLSSWLVPFEVKKGEVVWFNWSTYYDEADGLVHGWDAYDEDIDLEECATKRIPIHCWRDENNRQHLEIAKRH